MLVPRTRLLICFALIILPLTVVAAIAPAAAMLAHVGMAAFVLLALIDALPVYKGLEGVVVLVPDVIRLAKDRAGTLELTLAHSASRDRKIRLGLAWPGEIESPQDEMSAVLEAEHEHTRLEWPCTPLKRGLYPLDACYLETSSPLGFWGIRGRQALTSELRVYPDLLKERNNLAALFLNRGSFGIHARRQIGKGREFEKLREYMPGDSFDEIHWKATAKRGRPITKVFQIERTQEVYVLIDSSRLSARPAPTKDELQISEATESTLERFITSGMVLGLAAQKQGDLFGLVTFGSQVHSFIRAKAGKFHYGAYRDALYRLEPEAGNPDFDELCSFLRLKLRRRALLVLLTSLDDPVLAENFIKNIRLLNRQHLVLVNMLRPAAARPLFSNPHLSSTNDLYRELGGHSLWHDLRELERSLHHQGVHFSLLDNEKMSVDLVSQYIDIKRRQLL